METARGLRRLLGLLTLCATVLGQKEMSVKEGDQVELPCTYSSSSTNMLIEWRFESTQASSYVYYNGQLTIPYKGRAQFFPNGLQLRDVTRKDSGLYTCSATDTSLATPSLKETKTRLVVLIPPSVPTAQVPTSASIGSTAILYCVENDATPRPVFSWYKNKVKMPQDPKTSPAFQNATYTLDSTTGDLTFNPVTQGDSGEYYCEASNELGVQKSGAVLMETYEKNVGGIVAAVIIVLLILALIAFGIWFAYSRGYFGKKTNKKVIYSQPSETRSDKNFQQTSSFVV